MPGKSGRWHKKLYTVASISYMVEQKDIAWYQEQTSASKRVISERRLGKIFASYIVIEVESHRKLKRWGDEVVRVPC